MGTQHHQVDSLPLAVLDATSLAKHAQAQAVQHAQPVILATI
jgi:hypothetical protein